MALIDRPLVRRRSPSIEGGDRIFRVRLDVVAVGEALAPLRAAVRQAVVDLDVVCPDVATVASEIVAAFCESHRGAGPGTAPPSVDIEVSVRAGELTLTVNLPHAGDGTRVDGMRARVIDALTTETDVSVIADEDEFVCSFALAGPN